MENLPRLYLKVSEGVHQPGWASVQELGGLNSKERVSTYCTSASLWHSSKSAVRAEERGGSFLTFSIICNLQDIVNRLSFCVSITLCSA